MSRAVVKHRRFQTGRVVRCGGCSTRLTLTRQKAHHLRAGDQSAVFCSHECCAASRRVYTDEREKQREKKRRIRARYHSRGLTSFGKPVVDRALYEAWAERRVEPTRV